MRVLFDQATPVPIRTFLIGHDRAHGRATALGHAQNGDLLTVAEPAGFEVFLTTDKNMRYQQNMAGRTDCDRRHRASAVASPSAARGARRGRSERGDAWQLH